MTYLQLNSTRCYPVGITAIGLPSQLYIPTGPSSKPAYETDGVLIHACVLENDFLLAVRSGLDPHKPYFYLSICHARQKGTQTAVHGDTIFGDHVLSIDHIMAILCAKRPSKRLRTLAAECLDDAHEKRVVEVYDHLHETQKTLFDRLQQIKRDETPDLATWRAARNECLLTVDQDVQKLIDTARLLRSSRPGRVVEWQLIDAKPSLFRQAANPPPFP